MLLLRGSLVLARTLTESRGTAMQKTKAFELGADKTYVVQVEGWVAKKSSYQSFVNVLVLMWSNVITGCHW
jgi:hypothetical protein